MMLKENVNEGDEYLKGVGKFENTGKSFTIISLHYYYIESSV